LACRVVVTDLNGVDHEVKPLDCELDFRHKAADYFTFWVKDPDGTMKDWLKIGCRARFYVDPSASPSKLRLLGMVENVVVEQPIRRGEVIRAEGRELFYTKALHRVVTETYQNMEVSKIVEDLMRRYAPDVNLSALSFDGSDDWVDCGTDPSLEFGTSDFTLMAWVKLDTAKLHYVIRTSVGAEGYRVWIGSDSKVYFMVAGEGAERAVASVSVLSTNTWYFIAAVRHASTQTGEIYINGILDNSDTHVTWDNNITNSISLGIGGTYPNGYLDGLIDEVYIYNRALSQAEIQHNMNNPHDPVKDGLVLWLKFDENEGSVAADSSGKGNDGTINGAT
jgi:hypothetical protein